MLSSIRRSASAVFGHESSQRRAEVERRLRHEADQARVTAPAGLHSRTVEAVRQRSLQLGVSQLPWWREWIGGMAVAGLLLTVAIVLRQVPSGPKPDVPAISKGIFAIDLGFDEAALDSVMPAVLLAEARRIVDDARQIGQQFLGHLPLLSLDRQEADPKAADLLEAQPREG